MGSEFPERVIHGGTGKLQQEKTHKNFLDFSASVNPYPPPFAWHCNRESLSRYPDDNYSLLKDAIASAYNRLPEEICVGNGSIELIRVFCSVTLRGKRTFTYEMPTFGEYDLSARLAGGVFTPSIPDADVIFVCNPNNPTGVLKSKTDLLLSLDDSRKADALLFCDEAFIDLADPAQSLAGTPDPRIFVLESLTKSFAVPGLRFGFGFGDPDLIRKIETARSPWTVNAFAESFAIAALRHRSALEKSRSKIAQERAFLAKILPEMGLKPAPSSTNYLLLQYGKKVTSLCERLKRKGILVRDCTSFGLPSCIRIAVRKTKENRVLVETLSECLP